MSARVFDATPCILGEGPLWHPERGQLFWFDILGKKLLTREAEATREWGFDEHVSAGAWIDADTLLIASETSLFTFDLRSGAREALCALEADNPVTRCNDGRADPWGGFWIGTMGKRKEPEAGAIYRFYRGELRRLYDRITVSNAICFSPDRRFAYFADTDRHRIERQPLDERDGWPVGGPELFVDLARAAPTPDGLRPDGAVVDAAGRLWNAQVNAGQVACYDAEGRLQHIVTLPVTRATCPAFGGDDLGTLYVTTARDGLTDADRAAQADAGMTFAFEAGTTGQREHRFIP